MAVDIKDVQEVADALGKKFDEFKSTNDKRVEALEAEVRLGQQLRQPAEDVAGHASSSTTSRRSSSTLASVRPSVSRDRMVSVSATPGRTA